MSTNENELRFVSSTPLVATDYTWMQLALAMAARAGARAEVPVGAVLVRAGQLLGCAGNCQRASFDPTGHAEIQVLRQASLSQGNYRLVGSELFVSLEPCVMCLGAIMHARVERIVFAATEPRAGALVSRNCLSHAWFNHTIKISGGCLADSSRQLLQAFFKARRVK